MLIANHEELWKKLFVLFYKGKKEVKFARLSKDAFFPLGHSLNPYEQTLHPGTTLTTVNQTNPLGSNF
jgi:hypothetical protein